MFFLFIGFLSCCSLFLTCNSFHIPINYIKPILIHPLTRFNVAPLFLCNPEKEVPNKIIERNLTVLSKIKTKTNSFLKLIRYKNLFPTLLLSLSGGWLMKPSIMELLQTTTFLAATSNTLLIMSSSMIINDLFDIKIDKINHPERPLVTEEISVVEAVLTTFLLLGTSQYINIHYLSESLQIISNLATIQIILYTPILKRILFIKNISCASLVSFSVFYTGLASSTNQYTPLNKNFGIFSLVLTLIFMGSFYNELLLDMRDYEGDKQNKIATIPVLFGKKGAWFLSNAVLIFNIGSNFLTLSYLFNGYVASLFLLISSPMFLRSLKIQREKYSQESINNAVNKTTKQLFLMVLYFCSVSLIRP